MRTSLRIIAMLILATGTAVMVPQSAFADETRDRQWYLGALHVPEAQALSKGQETRIGVIDTGIAADHPDLVGSVKAGKTFGDAGDSLIDNTGNGTAAAAVLAGHGHGAGGAEGILGIAPNAELVSVGLGIESAPPMEAGRLVSEAIGSLVDEKVDIIAVTADLELGDNQLIDNPAAAAGIPVVTAAGVPIADAISVVGTDADGRAWEGAPLLTADASLAFAAPATDIPTASPDGEYGNPDSRGSYATAIVAGTLGLMHTRWPDAPFDVLTEQLAQRGTTGVEPGARDPRLGFGVVDPGLVLKSDIAGMEPVDPKDLSDDAEGGAADTADNAVAAPNSTLIAVIAIGGLLLLAALVVSVRMYDRKLHRRQAAGLAGPGSVPPIHQTGAHQTVGHTPAAGIVMPAQVPGATPPGGMAPGVPPATGQYPPPR